MANLEKTPRVDYTPREISSVDDLQSKINSITQSESNLRTYAGLLNLVLHRETADVNNTSGTSPDRGKVYFCIKNAHQKKGVKGKMLGRRKAKYRNGDDGSDGKVGDMIVGYIDLNKEGAIGKLKALLWSLVDNNSDKSGAAGYLDAQMKNILLYTDVSETLTDKLRAKEEAEKTKSAINSISSLSKEEQEVAVNHTKSQLEDVKNDVSGVGGSYVGDDVSLYDGEDIPTEKSEIKKAKRKENRENRKGGNTLHHLTRFLGERGESVLLEYAKGQVYHLLNILDHVYAELEENNDDLVTHTIDARDDNTFLKHKRREIALILGGILLELNEQLDDTFWKDNRHVKLQNDIYELAHTAGFPVRGTKGFGLKQMLTNPFMIFNMMVPPKFRRNFRKSMSKIYKEYRDGRRDYKEALWAVEKCQEGWSYRKILRIRNKQGISYDSHLKNYDASFATLSNLSMDASVVQGSRSSGADEGKLGDTQGVEGNNSAHYTLSHYEVLKWEDLSKGSLKEAVETVENSWENDSDEAKGARYRLMKRLIRGMSVPPKYDKGNIVQTSKDIVLTDAGGGKEMSPFFWKLMKKVIAEESGMRDQINAEYTTRIGDINDIRTDQHRAQGTEHLNTSYQLTNPNDKDELLLQAVSAVFQRKFGLRSIYLENIFSSYRDENGKLIAATPANKIRQMYKGESPLGEASNKEVFQNGGLSSVVRRWTAGMYQAGGLQKNAAEVVRFLADSSDEIIKYSTIIGGVIQGRSAVKHIGKALKLFFKGEVIDGFGELGDATWRGLGSAAFFIGGEKLSNRVENPSDSEGKGLFADLHAMVSPTYRNKLEHERAKKSPYIPVVAESYNDIIKRSFGKQSPAFLINEGILKKSGDHGIAIDIDKATDLWDISDSTRKNISEQELLVQLLVYFTREKFIHTWDDLVNLSKGGLKDTPLNDIIEIQADINKKIAPYEKVLSSNGLWEDSFQKSLLLKSSVERDEIYERMTFASLMCNKLFNGNVIDQGMNKLNGTSADKQALKTAINRRTSNGKIGSLLKKYLKGIVVEGFTPASNTPAKTYTGFFSGLGSALRYADSQQGVTITFIDHPATRAVKVGSNTVNIPLYTYFQSTKIGNVVPGSNSIFKWSGSTTAFTGGYPSNLGHNMDIGDKLPKASSAIPPFGLV